jgi:hypothetical protein
MICRAKVELEAVRAAADQRDVAAEACAVAAEQHAEPTPLLGSDSQGNSDLRKSVAT